VLILAEFHCRGGNMEPRSMRLMSVVASEAKIFTGDRDNVP